MTHSERMRQLWKEKQAILLAASRKGGQASKDLPHSAQLERTWRIQRTKASKVAPNKAGNLNKQEDTAYKT